MKRSWIKRRTGLAWKGSKPLARRRLRVKGVSTPSLLKDEIQDLLREGVIKRDGGCVLRHFPQAGSCGGYRKDGKLILQADHMVSRSRSVCYGDLRNAICLCKNHHFYFKKRNSSLFWELVKIVIGPERFALHVKWRDDKTPHHMTTADWHLTKIALRQEIDKMEPYKAQ